MNEFAFEGAVIFELKMRVLGCSLERLLRAKYRYTPDWPYFDPTVNGEASAAPFVEVCLELKVSPLPPKPKRRPDPFADVRDRWQEWRETRDLIFLGALNRRTMARLSIMIDADARHQDQERRHAANPGFPKPWPKL